MQGTHGYGTQQEVVMSTITKIQINSGLEFEVLAWESYRAER